MKIENLNEANEADKDKARAIIQKYTSAKASYSDFLTRIMPFSTGTKRPSTDKDGSIDIIPVLDELVRNGYVRKLPGGMYKRGDVISSLMSDLSNKVVNKALDGDLSKEGKLGATQVSNMGHLAGDGTAASKLANAPRNYKAGGKYSGVSKELISKTIKEKDASYAALSDSSKAMLDSLASLSNPLPAFKILKKLIKLQSSKKGYVPFIEYVKMTYGDDYISSLDDLVSVGLINPDKNTINTQSVKDVKNILSFLKSESVDGIKNIDKVGAFLPNFLQNATSTISTKHRAINNILTSPRFKQHLNAIDTKLTDEKLNTILQLSKGELKDKPVARVISYIAQTLGASTVEELKNKISTKKTMLANYGSEENKDSKESGRYGEFLNHFDLT